jgi:hypothetical protein
MTHRVRWVDRRCLLEDHGDQSAANHDNEAVDVLPIQYL